MIKNIFPNILQNINEGVYVDVAGQSTPPVFRKGDKVTVTQPAKRSGRDVRTGGDGRR